MNGKFLLRHFIYTLLLLACAGQVTAQTQDTPPDPRLMQMEKMRFDAMIRKDTFTLSRLLADDLVFINTNGVVDSKSSFLKNIASGFVEYKYILPERSTTRVEGNFGWVYGKANIRFRVAAINMTFDQYISFINLYRLNRNQWTLVAAQNAKVNNDVPDFSKPPPQVQKSIQPLIY
ncbi:MAG TPA: nuclear transport factor 2 family protein [Puia sp.]|nr:nuclear transport factor 2 family protein [Puia sp.]